MAKKIQKTDNTENQNQSKKATTKYPKVSETFLEVARIFDIDVKTLFLSLESFYLENEKLFSISKYSKLIDTTYNFKPSKEIGVFETSLDFSNKLNSDFNLTPAFSVNKIFSILLAFQCENDETFLFKIKDLDFKKQYTKDSLTSIFQEYNKNLNSLHKQNLELKGQLDVLVSQIIKEREEVQEIRNHEKEERKKDRELLKKVLSAMQDLNNSNVTERTKFINNFETRFQKMENRFDILVDTLTVIVTNLENLSSDDVE